MIYIYMKSLHMFLFFNRWGGDNNPLPDGLIYEGVSEQPIRVCDNLFVCLIEPKVRTTHPCMWRLICLLDWAQSQNNPSVYVTNDLSAWLSPKHQSHSNTQPQLLPSVTQPVFLHLPFTRSLVHSLFQYHVRYVAVPVFLHLPFTRSLAHSLFQCHVMDRWLCPVSH